jgi:hypothetical protein
MSRAVQTEDYGTTSIALSATIGPETGGGGWELISVTANFSAAPTTSEFMTLTLDSSLGADYDTVIRATDPSVGSATSVEFVLNERFSGSDKIVIAYANTDTVDIFWSARWDSDPAE